MYVDKGDCSGHHVPRETFPYQRRIRPSDWPPSDIDTRRQPASRCPIATTASAIPPPSPCAFILMPRDMQNWRHYALANREKPMNHVAMIAVTALHGSESQAAQKDVTPSAKLVQVGLVCPATGTFHPDLPPDRISCSFASWQDFPRAAGTTTRSPSTTSPAVWCNTERRESDSWTAPDHLFATAKPFRPAPTGRGGCGCYGGPPEPSIPVLG